MWARIDRLVTMMSASRVGLSGVPGRAVSGIMLAIILMAAPMAALVFAVACDGGPDLTPASNTPTQTPTAEATASTPTSPPSSVFLVFPPSVRFEPAVPTQFLARADPFPPPQTRTQVLVAAVDGEPRLLLDTKDRVYVDQWSPDGRAILVDSFSHERRLGKSTVLFVDDPDASHLEVESHGPRDATWSPDGSWVAFIQVDEYRQATSVWIGSPDGDDTRVLAGLGPALRFRGWSPDSSAVLVAQMPEYWSDGAGPMWYVSVGLGATVQVGDHLVEFPQYTGMEGLWKPPVGDELVYVAGGDVHIFSRGYWDSRQVTFSGDFRNARWSPDGKYILASQRIVDPETGAMTAIPNAQPYAEAAISPDSRLVAVMEAETDQHPKSLGTLLYDVEQEIVTRLTDPDEGYDARREWTPDGGHLIVWRSVCWGCDAATGKVLIVDAQTGEEFEVTDGFEHAASYTLSADGNRLLVTGTRLRLVSLDGTVLREIVPPQGMEVAQALWSPDGTRFVYVLRPTGFSDV